MNELDFIPVRGTEAAILGQKPREGYFYVATDTGKMYADIFDMASGEAIHKVIGGSGASVIYGINSELTQLPDETFLLKPSDLEDQTLSVNVGDLIINIDGRFLKVNSLQSDGSFIASLIAVSGTGGGTGGGGGTGPITGTASITNLMSQRLNYRYGDTIKLKFKFVSTYADGSSSGSAPATFHINNGVAVYETEINQGDNEIDVTKYINAGTQRLTIRVSADIGAATPLVVTYTWTIVATQLVLTWNYDISTINYSNQNFKLNWFVSGDDVDKTTHIIIDDNENLETKVITSVNNKNEEIVLPGLSHGIHTVEMYMDATISGVKLPTERIKNQLIFVDEENGITPIIAYKTNTYKIKQYDTLAIDYVIYNPSTKDSFTEVVIRENDQDIDIYSNIANGVLNTWNYAPTIAGNKKITLVCGTTEVSFFIDVEAIDLGDTEEVEGYAFKLKASDFSSNEALRNWKTELKDTIYNNWSADKKIVDIEFSENFDWINGGLQSETLSDGSKRNYICVRAGTTMTINYDLFKMASSSVRANGKTFKFVFKATNCRDYDAQVLSCYNQGAGLTLTAQNATLTIGGETLATPYCEDSYIEFEFDIWKEETNEYGRRYLMFWLDGVPTGIKVYTTGASLEQTISVPITIGSADCDVNIYLVKAYEKHLDDNEHLNNFILDAFNATELMARFLRNDILENGQISYSKLVERNPGCQVYLYDIPRMTKNKKDKVGTGDGGADDYITFALYENTSTTPVVTAKDVVMKVQGTSSARYGVAAFNIDSKFEDGFTTSNGQHIDGYSIKENSIPVNYFCTKVNVASSEGANNALNQEWYNNYQPWKNRLRRKNSRARDCMEFKPGIIFLKDRNTTTAIDEEGAATEYDTRNVFEDTAGYINNPYYKQYAIGCMGNSKDNIEVLHDITNPYECCIEVADNQEPGQWMTIPQGAYITKDDEGEDVVRLVSFDLNATLDDTTLCDDGIERSNRALWETGLENVCEFRYPDGISDLKDKFKTWTSEDQAKWDLQALLDDNIITEDRIQINPYDSAVEGWYRFVSWMARSNPAAAQPSNELSEPKTYGPHTFKKGGVEGYNNGSLAGVTISTYAGTYTHDTYKYRMAKMLSECEDYLCMESVVFHYLFIERHTMVDNVAKNTFWSTEDGIHWNLTKNYDNDTADGNDNQGRLSLTYGIECLDVKDSISNTYYFNAYQSVWFNFINGLYTARREVYSVCNQKGAWDSSKYLSTFNTWQSCIPERCWIEDYYRKYRRPRELGLDGEKFYLEMLEGGKKTHQRKQYEIYQESYITSLYNPEDYQGTNVITLRSNGTLPSVNGLVDTIKIVLYADGYIRAMLGSTEAKPIRAKKGEQHSVQFVSANDMSLNNATFYIPFASNIQSITDIGLASPTELSFSSAKKLREIDVHHDPNNPNTILKSIGFAGTPLLEKITAQYCPNTNTALDLSGLKNLKELKVDGSGFTTATFADGGLLETAWLNDITDLVMKNLTHLEDFSIEDYKQLRTINIINSNINTYNLIQEIKKSIKQVGASKTTILSYNLQNVSWNIDKIVDDSNITHIDITNQKIPILDYLLDSSATKTIDDVSYSVGLTGQLNVVPSIIDSIDYYNEYIKPTAFANFDISFTDGATPLVSIENAAGKVQWARRIMNGSIITESFLSDINAPDGKFTKPDDYSDAQYDYIFQNKWNVYDTNGVLLTETPIENTLPIGYTVTQDIIIRPVIEKKLRKFTVIFYNHDNSIISEKQVEYGTVASKVMPLPPLYVGEEPSDVFETYGFKGYSINNNGQISDIKDLSDIRITSDINFIAQFDIMSVYNNPLGEGYFEISDSGLIRLQNTNNSAEFLTLKGKITIPKQINNITVTGLNTGCFQNGYGGHTSGITHIFFEPSDGQTNENHNIKTLGQFCINGTSLQYMELPPYIEEVPNADAAALEGVPNTAKIIISPNMTKIPASLFRDYKGTLITREDALNDDGLSDPITLPGLTFVGENAFLNATGMQNVSFVLPNILTFGGILGGSDSYCNSLTFGTETSATDGEMTFSGDSTTIIWGAKNITVYGNEIVQTFVANHFSSSVSALTT